MVSKIKVSDVIESQEDPITATATEPEPATPEPHESTTPTEGVDVCETTVEPQPSAVEESADTAAVEPPTPQTKKTPKKEKGKGDTHPTPDRRSGSADPRDGAPSGGDQDSTPQGQSEAPGQT